MAKLLLDFNADPNIQQHDGNTPLHHAASSGDLKIVSLLLNYKGNPNITNSILGRTPLHNAVDGGHEKIVKLMVKYDGNAELRDRIGKSPIDLAASTEIRNLLSGKNQENSSEKSTRTSPLYMPSLDPIETIPSIPMHSFENITLSPHSSRSNSEYSSPSKDLKIIDIRKKQRIKLSTHTQPDLNRSLNSVIEPEAEKKREVSFGGDEKPQLYNWLVMTKLDELFDVLLKSGYDDIKQMCNQLKSSMPLSDDILEGIGIKKPGLRRRLLGALNEDAFPNPIKLANKRKSKWRCCSVATPTNEGLSLPTMRNWLYTLGLEILLPNFEFSGYDDIEHNLALMNSRWPITEEILQNDVKISKPGHRHRILSKLKDDCAGITTFKRNYGGFSNRGRKEEFIFETDTNSTACEICKLM